MSSLLAPLWGLLKLMLDGFFTVLTSFILFVLDGIFTVILAFVSSLDLSSLVFTQAALWSDLPPQAIYFINACGLPQGCTLIAGAMTIRLLLNLLPAAVTRV